MYSAFLIHLTLALSYKEREREFLPLVGRGQEGVSWLETIMIDMIPNIFGLLHFGE